MNNKEPVKKSRDWKLIDNVIAHSNGSSWDEAKNEWAVIDYYEEPNATCICGQEHITHCHTIENMETGETIGPIGSSCIEKFDSVVMNNDMSLSKTFVQLDHAFNNFVEIDEIRTLLRNRKLMTNLLENNIFGSDIESEFYGKMIRKTTPMSDRQESWMRKIIFFDVKPYIQNEIKDYKTHISIGQSSTKLENIDELTRQTVLLLGEEFKQSSTTLSRLHPHLSKDETLRYLETQNVFKSDKNKDFFKSVITKPQSITQPQAAWLRDIISKDIKPFVLDQVNDYYKSFILSEDDLNVTLNQAKEM